MRNIERSPVDLACMSELARAALGDESDSVSEFCDAVNSLDVPYAETRDGYISAACERCLGGITVSFGDQTISASSCLASALKRS